MKVKLGSDEWELFDESPYGIEVEVPDALMTEYRKLRERLDDITQEVGQFYYPAKEAWEAKLEAEAEARRDEIRKATLIRQQATPHAMITEQSRDCARKIAEASMKQFLMMPIGEMPRGIVYADSPLRKKDDAD